MVDLIEVEIERIVLRGFQPADRHRIGLAIERELIRLFSENGVPPWITRNEELLLHHNGSCELPPGSEAQTTGTQIARRVYEG